MHILSGSRLCTILFTLRPSDSCSFQATVGILGILEFQNSKLVPFPPRKYLHCFSTYLSLCRVSQKSLFETICVSTALISKSQVETSPAEWLLDSLSHSSLTHKQLVTLSAFFPPSPARRSILHQCNNTHAKLIFLIIH